MKLLDVVITSREEQGNGVAVLELGSQSGQALPEFEAGAHIDVYIDQGIIRQYSLCNPPGQAKFYRIGVLYETSSRGGSEQIFKGFIVGKTLKISEPRNHFSLNYGAELTVLLGGGIGITPLLAMAYELQRMNKAFELHYCLRSRGAGAFVNELEQRFKGKVFIHYDDEDQQQRLSPKALFSPYDSGKHIYICGPAGFIKWVTAEAESCHYPASQIHFEYFSAQVDMQGGAFEVYCAKSDLLVSVEENESIVKALATAGIRVEVSCEEGICGTCITDVIEGEPDHRDHFLTDDEKEANDQMALCCSRAKGQRLVIDL